MPKQTSTWKSVERRLARMFGTERNQDTHGYDFKTEFIIGEVKHRDTLPKWIEDAMAQVDLASATDGDGLLPVVILHAKGQRFEDCYAFIRVSNMSRLHDFMVMYAGMEGK